MPECEETEQADKPSVLADLKAKSRAYFSIQDIRWA